MGVFPADHLIVGHNHFEKSLNSAFSLVKKEQILVTIGIKPSYPSTAYGYIQYEPGTKNKNGYHVKTFAEKPHETLAKRFIKSGDFLWNAGIFVWEVKSLLLSLEKHMPDLHDAIKKIGLRIEKSDSFDDIWERPIDIRSNSQINIPKRSKNNILKVAINDNEYFLVENRNNHFKKGVSIDSTSIDINKS